MLGVRRAIGLNPEIKLVFAECKGKVISFLELYSILTVGMFIPPLYELFLNQSGIVGSILYFACYLVLTYLDSAIIFFSIPLVVTKNYSAFNAFKEGLSKLNTMWPT